MDRGASDSSGAPATVSRIPVDGADVGTVERPDQ